MKKEDVTGIIVYLIIIVLAILFGVFALQDHANHSYFTGMGFAYVIYIILSVLVGALLNAILFEVAHVLGAKLGKYEIVSVNILGLLFYKEKVVVEKQ